MNNKNFWEALGIEGTNIEDEDVNYELFDNYVPYGGGGAGIKNGHYGCKHSDEAKKIMSEKKKGVVPWNKNVKGYKVHTEDSKRRMGNKLSGSGNGRAILNEDTVYEIINLYLSQPKLNDVGDIKGNGIKMSYIWSFSKTLAPYFGTTPAAIKRLLQKKSWKHVWNKFEISDKN